MHLPGTLQSLVWFLALPKSTCFFFALVCVSIYGQIYDHTVENYWISLTIKVTMNRKWKWALFRSVTYNNGEGGYYLEMWHITTLITGVTLCCLTIYTMDSTCEEGSLSVWMIYKVMHTQALFSFSSVTHWAVPTCGSYSRCRNIEAVHSRETKNFRTAVHILFTESSRICWIGNAWI